MLRFVVALGAEARPLMDRYRLQRDPAEHAFHVYRRDDVGLVVSGRATAEYEDGTTSEMKEGDLFHVPGVPHDSRVVGDEPYVSLHFLGADHYAD